METLSKNYIRRGLFWLVVTTVMYLLLNGAQIFETALIVPSWTSAPPASLYLFQGDYGLDFQAFWIIFHSLHEITFLLAIIFCWKIKPVRYALLALLAAHIGVRVWTVAYFAPTIIEFQHLPVSNTVDQAMTQKAALWQNLNYLRVAVFMAVSLALLPLVRQVAKLAYGKDSAKT